MSSSAGTNCGQGRKLEGEQEENPAKKAVLGALPSSATVQAMQTEQEEAVDKAAQQPPYTSHTSTSPIPTTDGSKVPLPNEEKTDGEASMASASIKEPMSNTEPIVTNYMDKFFNQTVFTSRRTMQRLHKNSRTT